MGWFDRKEKKSTAGLAALSSKPLRTSAIAAAPPLAPPLYSAPQPQQQSHLPPVPSDSTRPYWQSNSSQKDFGYRNPAFQSVGYPPPPLPWQGGPTQPPIVVNQHYYLMPSTESTQVVPLRSKTSHGLLSKLDLNPYVDLANSCIPGIVPISFDDGRPSWHGPDCPVLNQSAAFVDQLCDRFSHVLTGIDHNKYTGNEPDLFAFKPTSGQYSQSAPVATTGGKGSAGKPKKSDQPSRGTGLAQTDILSSGGYFAKVDLYSNSRLPLKLPPLKLYIPTYPLLCLAAQYSERVYDSPRGPERDAHVKSDARTGGKAMVIKSVPMDHMNMIVFAIRGTTGFMDWAVNFNTVPTAPIGFLDDPGNLCHAGFLSVACKMIKPVAARLRQLLEEDPNRRTYSLLITGHSAGGAVATLLYRHMLCTSREAESELSLLTSSFRRIHCVTFGTPPVSLLPLQKPDVNTGVKHRTNLTKSLFLTFVNEGDPVARADKAYMRSLIDLYLTPAPVIVNGNGPGKDKTRSSSASKPAKSSMAKASKSSLKSSLVIPTSNKISSGRPAHQKAHSTGSPITGGSHGEMLSRSGPIWPVPPNPLSSPGRIIVLRSGNPDARVQGSKNVEDRLNEGVVAQIVTDQELRGVVWGDPVCHVMKLYAGRMETLAVGAVTAQGTK